MINKNSFNCTIKSFFIETLKFMLLTGLSLGIALPWTLDKYLKFIYAHTTLKHGLTLKYSNANKKKFMLDLLLAYLIGILTLGILLFAIPGYVLDHIVKYTTIADDNDNTYHINVKKDDFIKDFGIKTFLFGLLCALCPIFVLPFLILNLTNCFLVYRSNINPDGESTKGYKLRLKYDLNEKKEFITKTATDVLLTFVTLCVYSPYLFVNLIERVLNFLDIEETEVEVKETVKTPTPVKPVIKAATPVKAEPKPFVAPTPEKHVEEERKEEPVKLDTRTAKDMLKDTKLEKSDEEIQVSVKPETSISDTKTEEGKIYLSACNLYNAKKYDEAKENFRKIKNYKNSKLLYEECLKYSPETEPIDEEQEVEKPSDKKEEVKNVQTSFDDEPELDDDEIIED